MKQFSHRPPHALAEALAGLAAHPSPHLGRALVDEHPQVVAALLSFLPTRAASSAAVDLPTSKVVEVLARAALLDDVDFKALHMVAGKLLTTLDEQGASPAGDTATPEAVLAQFGMPPARRAAMLLNDLPPNMYAEVSERLGDFHPSAMDVLRPLLFDPDDAARALAPQERLTFFRALPEESIAPVLRRRPWATELFLEALPREERDQWYRRVSDRRPPDAVELAGHHEAWVRAFTALAGDGTLTPRTRPGMLLGAYEAPR